MVTTAPSLVISSLGKLLKSALKSGLEFLSTKPVEILGSALNGFTRNQWKYWGSLSSGKNFESSSCFTIYSCYFLCPALRLKCNVFNRFQLRSSTGRGASLQHPAASVVLERSTSLYAHSPSSSRVWSRVAAHRHVDRSGVWIQTDGKGCDWLCQCLPPGSTCSPGGVFIFFLTFELIANSFQHYCLQEKSM